MNIFFRLIGAKRRWPLLLMLTIWAPSLHGQYRISKHFTQRVDTIDLSDENYILRDKEGFTAFLPQKGKAAGALIFFVGKKVEANSEIDEMSILEPAIKKNMAVVFITSGNYFDFYFDERDLEKIDSTMQDCIKRTKIPKNRLIFTGNDLGGTRAMKYAVYCEQGKSKFGIHPAAISICDSPLDMIRYWESNARAVENSFDSTAKDMGLRVTQYLLIGMSGTPETRRERFISYSPYCYSSKEGGNAKFLSAIPIRAYLDSDIVWYVENMRKDFYSMNAVDMAGLINQLKLSGNSQAELVIPVSLKKKSSDNTKQDAWSLIDMNELVDWLYRVTDKSKEKSKKK